VKVFLYGAANLPPIGQTPAKQGDGCPLIPEATVSLRTDARIERGVVKTPRERAEEKRQAKLDLVREQVASGSLVIRRMTEEERRRYPPRPAQPKKLGRR
jgi:hypothetical protein